MMTINVSRAKAKFLEVIRRAEDSKNTIIEKKGVPVAAVLPYDEYINLTRIRNYLAMRRIYQITKKAGVTAQDILEESRRQLETRSDKKQQ